MEEELQVPPPPPLDESGWRSSGSDDDGPRRRRESMVNKLISTVYSGPTISDIESALSFTGGADQNININLADDAMDNYSSGGVSTSPAVVLSPAETKVLSKMENKYTLKIKTSGNGLAEDGYKWRKYGQKSIKNSPNPRSYYRCTNPRCNAKKQVERATDEADTLLVTYEGLHLHYTYSHFLLQHHQQQAPPAPAPAPAAAAAGISSKKPKLQPRGGGPAAPGDLDGLFLLHGGGSSWQHAAAAASPRRREDGLIPHQQEAEGYDDDGFVDHHRRHQQQHMSSNNKGQGQGGLLEDVVPLLVRRPCSSSGGGGGGGASTSTPIAAASRPTSSSSVSSWNNNPTSPYYSIDMAILSNIF